MASVPRSMSDSAVANREPSLYPPGVDRAPPPPPARRRQGKDPRDSRVIKTTHQSPMVRKSRRVYCRDTRDDSTGGGTVEECCPMTDDPATAPFPNQVNALHAAVRQWSAHILRTLPYIDLLFAFAYAELGEPSCEARLVEAARTVMEVPIPSPKGHSYPNHRSFEEATSAVVTNFLFKSFKFRPSSKQ